MMRRSSPCPQQGTEHGCTIGTTRARRNPKNRLFPSAVHSTRGALVRQLHNINDTNNTSFLEYAQRPSKQHKAPQIVTENQCTQSLVSGINATCLSLSRYNSKVHRRATEHQRTYGCRQMSHRSLQARTFLLVPLSRSLVAAR